ncbi:hypothetical protein M8C21_006007, partial [Ambrosia artemisiifolia]
VRYSINRFYKSDVVTICEGSDGADIAYYENFKERKNRERLRMICLEILRARGEPIALWQQLTQGITSSTPIFSHIGGGVFGFTLLYSYSLHVLLRLVSLLNFASCMNKENKKITITVGKIQVNGKG